MLRDGRLRAGGAQRGAHPQQDGGVKVQRVIEIEQLIVDGRLDELRKELERRL